MNQLTADSSDKSKTANSAVNATESEFRASLQDLDNVSDGECAILSENQLNALLRSKHVSTYLMVVNEPPKKKLKFKNLTLYVRLCYRECIKQSVIECPISHQKMRIMQSFFAFRFQHIVTDLYISYNKIFMNT